jgi:cell division protein ZapA
MAEVLISIGGRNHAVSCRDGEEDRLRTLGRMLDERSPLAQRAAGTAGGERAMLFVALMLADDLDEALTKPAGGGITDQGLARIADRIERLAEALEQSAPNA